MSNPAQQLKQCQNGWSAFTTRENREWYEKGLRRAVEICRELRRIDYGLSPLETIVDCARAIEAEIPPTPTVSVVREGR